MPDLISYDAWISACAIGHAARACLGGVQGNAVQGILPDTIAHSALISAYEKRK